jgi:hypothetical protein
MTSNSWTSVLDKGEWLALCPNCFPLGKESIVYGVTRNKACKGTLLQNMRKASQAKTIKYPSVLNYVQHSNSDLKNTMTKDFTESRQL